jgi:hypothetical protein
MPAELALWATVLSVGTILSVADFGVGQLILTTMHERGAESAGERQLVAGSVVAMTILALSLLAIATLAFAFGHLLEGVRWRTLLVGVILLRLLLIPYGAFLMALERYHERKMAEALAYTIAAAMVVTGLSLGWSVSLHLLVLNTIVTLGAVGIGLRAWHLGLRRLPLQDVSIGGVRDVFHESFPYFVNNVSGLAIYGGFIALSRLVLDDLDVARLALLHTVLFMHLYQVFELIFRSVQPRMHDERLMLRLRQLLIVTFCIGLAAAGTVGPAIAQWLFKKYQFAPAELMIYTGFVFFEVYFLMLVSRMQMRSAMKAKLQWISLVKAAAFGCVLAATYASGRADLRLYATLLTVFSATMAYMASRLSRTSAGVLRAV